MAAKRKPRTVSVPTDPAEMIRQWAKLKAKAEPNGPRHQALGTRKVKELNAQFDTPVWIWHDPAKNPAMCAELVRDMVALGAVLPDDHPLQGKI